MSNITTAGTTAYTVYNYPDYTRPEADISINNNRLRKYNGNHIYLDNGSEFQIELTNKSTSAYLAKIKLNGNYIGDGGIVLRPGEHEYLERYLDTNKKFKFNTYDVKNNKHNRNAIKNNGIVEIEFYKEYRPAYWSNPYWSGTSASSSYPKSILTVSDTVNVPNVSLYTCENNTIETGRVEMGSNSNQSFTYVDMEFEILLSKSVEFKLLPSSQKNVIPKEVRNYCTDCGRRQKNGWQFCPGCGTRN